MNLEARCSALARASAFADSASPRAPPPLLPVLPKDFIFPLSVCLVTHEDLRHEARIEVVLDALEAGLRVR